MNFEVRRDDPRTTRVTETAPAPIAEGEARLAVERFGLTANNVTYAVMGEAMSYWSFFPADDPEWGRVPAWGFAEVTESRADGVEVGERFYGFFPMATDLTVRPRADERGFVDVTDHRRELPAVYNEYARTRPDAPRPDETLLLRPLFGTSFLIALFLGERDNFGATRVALSSASSKTAYALAFLLSQADDGTAVIGLTSSRNREFVASLGVYDQVVPYDEIPTALPRDEPIVFVDFAGDPQVVAAVHESAGDRLHHSAAVGMSHWEELGAPAGGLPGPAPEFFFAPTEFVRLRDALGADELRRRSAAGWQAFLAQVGDWMEIEHADGRDALERVWAALLRGDADPRRGHVLRLT